jgi:4-aminobutyrate aminotransferase/(S)-3-amino-2-methylpropionate transaminase
VIDDEGLHERAHRLGAHLLEGLRERAAGHASVADVRGRGLMLALEFAVGSAAMPRPDLAKALTAHALANHLVLLTCGTYGQVVRIIPPLVTTDDEVELALGIIGEGLEAIGA